MKKRYYVRLELTEEEWVALEKLMTSLGKPTKGDVIREGLRVLAAQ